MRKIICVALNPAMDKTINVDRFEVGCINAIGEISYQVGGRGINVAKVLQNFDHKCIVTGFVGGVWADQFRTTLMKRGIETKFFKLIHDTRTNTKLIDTATGICTTINERGPHVPEEILERFIQSFTIMCKQDDIIVLTGGTPPGVPDDIYYTLTCIAKEKGAKVILDARGELLKKGVLAGPDMVKINYRDYVPKEFWNQMTEAIYHKIIAHSKRLGVPKVLVSVGKQGALYVHTDKEYYAKSVDVGVDLKYPVAAGDAMVSALVMSMIEEFDDLTTLRYAVACGAACVIAKDTKGCMPMKVNELIPKVDISRL
ncbi:MAG: 1-phosphofructokinase family hexose kinase [Cellulosilyticaceae bacterium]